MIKEEKKKESTPYDEEGRARRRSGGIIPFFLNFGLAFGEGFMSIVTGILAAVLILYSGYVLYDSFYKQRVAGNYGRDLSQYKPAVTDDSVVPLNGSSLSAVNPDYRAWLTLFNTKIDYPVMQGPDDLYYASHDVYGESSITGAIYLATNNNGAFGDSYSLVYGHHMDSNAMFGSLDKFLDEPYFDSHREGVLTTANEAYDLYTFAVMRTNAYEPNVYNVGSITAASVLNFIKSDEGTVIYRDGVANSNSKIIAFSTCAGADTNGRLVVFAVLFPRDMTEVINDGLTLRVNSYDGVYDGLWHSIEAQADDPNAVIEYSTDGGKTWSTEKPQIRDFGTVTLLVRATAGSKSVTASTFMRVSRAPVIVAADEKSKVFGTEDPEFTATVTGLIGDDQIEYSVSRPGAGTDEAIGRYKEAIVASGETPQGNYEVTYINADFFITDVEIVTDSEPPLALFMRRFEPGEGDGKNAWALINLLCVILTAYLFLPLLHLRDKFGRRKQIEKLAEEEAQIAELQQRDPVSFEKNLKRFKRRTRIGLCFEGLDVVAAIVAFILTEDMRAPMVLVDRWTPLMAVLMLLIWVIDLVALRINDNDLVNEEHRFRKQIDRMRRAFTLFCYMYMY